MIVRRWTAYRVGQAQRERWKARREKDAAIDEGTDPADVDLLADLPDGLVG